MRCEKICAMKYAIKMKYKKRCDIKYKLKWMARSDVRWDMRYHKIRNVNGDEMWDNIKIKWNVNWGVK